MHRVFTAPITEPGQRTLLATVETWAAVLAIIGRGDLTRYGVIDAAIKQATGDPMRRVTLPDELAAYVLTVAGVSA